MTWQNYIKMLKGNNNVPEFTIHPQKTTMLCSAGMYNFAAVKRKQQSLKQKENGKS